MAKPGVPAGRSSSSLGLGCIHERVEVKPVHHFEGTKERRQLCIDRGYLRGKPTLHALTPEPVVQTSELSALPQQHPVSGERLGTSHLLRKRFVPPNNPFDTGFRHEAPPAASSSVSPLPSLVTSVARSDRTTSPTRVVPDPEVQQRRIQASFMPLDLTDPAAFHYRQLVVAGPHRILQVYEQAEKRKRDNSEIAKLQAKARYFAMSKVVKDLGEAVSSLAKRAAFEIGMKGNKRPVPLASRSGRVDADGHSSPGPSALPPLEIPPSRQRVASRQQRGTSRMSNRSRGSSRGADSPQSIRGAATPSSRRARRVVMQTPVEDTLYKPKNTGAAAPIPPWIEKLRRTVHPDRLPTPENFSERPRVEVPVYVPLNVIDEALARWQRMDESVVRRLHVDQVMSWHRYFEWPTPPLLETQMRDIMDAAGGLLDVRRYVRLMFPQLRDRDLLKIALEAFIAFLDQPPSPTGSVRTTVQLAVSPGAGGNVNAAVRDASQRRRSTVVATQRRRSSSNKFMPPARQPKASKDSSSPLLASADATTAEEEPYTVPASTQTTLRRIFMFPVDELLQRHLSAIRSLAPPPLPPPAKATGTPTAALDASSSSVARQLSAQQLDRLTQLRDYEDRMLFVQRCLKAAPTGREMLKTLYDEYLKVRGAKVYRGISWRPFFKRFGRIMPEEDLQAHFAAQDRDGDGFLCFDEFIRAVWRGHCPDVRCPP